MGTCTRSTRSPLSAAAGSATVVLGLVLTWLLHDQGGEPAYVRLLLGTLAAAHLVMGTGLTVVNCPESRVSSCVLATLAVTGTLLSTFVGVPGSAPTALGPAHYSLLVLGPAIPLLVVLDARRQATPRARQRPYAL